jgi:hypothetical protein
MQIKSPLMPMLLLLICSMSSILTPAQDQPASQRPSDNSVPIIQTTVTAGTDDEAVLAQMLQQSIAEARAAKSLAEARLQEVVAWKKIATETDPEIIGRYKTVITEQDQLIQRKQKQLDELKCSKFKLFVLFSWRSCS